MPTGKLDIDVPWGPFSPVYLGISHILKKEAGVMADIALFAGRESPAALILPENTFDYVQHLGSGDRRATVRAIPENVAQDYSSFSLRYFLDPQGDTVLARFTVENEHEIRCILTFRNTSGVSRKYFFGLGINASGAAGKVRLRKSLRPWWLPARDYAGIEAYQKVFGIGCRQCLTRVFTWGIEEQVLAQAFGGWEGDRVTYRMSLPKPLRNGFVYLRYIKYSAVPQTWELRVGSARAVFSFPQTWAIPGGGWGKNRDAFGEWCLLRICVGPVPDTDAEVELRPLDAPGNDTARIWLDGMLFQDGLLEGDCGGEPLLDTMLTDEPSDASFHAELEKHDGADASFGIIMNGKQKRRLSVRADIPFAESREGEGSMIGFLRRLSGAPAPSLERDEAVSRWGLLRSCGISVPPDSEKTLSFRLSSGEPPGNSLKRRETVHDSSDSSFPCATMIARLKDALLFNINYPFKVTDEYSHYFVPAKYFPLPYSWDGGFIALGLSVFAPGLARKEIEYFFADPSLDFPMLYCGSPVPTQFYALWHLYQSTLDASTLSGTYDGLLRMYNFYLGRTPGSVVNAGNDGLLSTYPYCYNLGIDDHPIQRRAEQIQTTRGGLYSIILLAQILRAARILRNMAFLLGNHSGLQQFTEDIDLLSGIIDLRMWDEKSGLYGWLQRTSEGVGPVRLDGCDGDRSACTFFPLFAGLLSHRKRLLGHLMNPARFLTDYGISSVDMSAPSYNPRGYWNGGIWPVMQWYIWRGLLEAGEPATARMVADRIFSTWNRSFEEHHYLGEHFMIAPEAMNGAPNFGGLSAVLIPMHAAYYSKFEVTTPFDVIVTEKVADPVADVLSLNLRAPFLTTASWTCLVNMGRGERTYRILRNGRFFGKTVSDEFGHCTLRFPRPLENDFLLMEPDRD